MHWKTFSLALCAAVFFSGCRDQSAPRVYTVPKEDLSPAGTHAQGDSMPQTLPMPQDPMASMANQTLPDEVLNRGASRPAWVVPDDWEERPPSPMRIATFEASDATGVADIAITSFPGDVGGMLANVNRWRSQLGLPPTSQAEIDRAAQTLETPSGAAIALEFSNGTTSTLVATLRQGDASWFIKMTGPAALIGREGRNFRAFVRTIDFSATPEPASAY